MKITCDWERCVSDCKHYYVCNLHTPSTKRLGEIRSEIIWIHNRLIEINKAINELHQIDWANLPKSFEKYINPKTASLKITELREEKHKLLEQLREYQIKEKNMNKLLKRRIK